MRFTFLRQLRLTSWVRTPISFPSICAGKPISLLAPVQRRHSEFQKIIDHRGVDPESPLVALAHLGAARSYALTNDVPHSRRSYEEFFTLWKDADPELSVLKKARDEYAKLVH